MARGKLHLFVFVAVPITLAVLLPLRSSLAPRDADTAPPRPVVAPLLAEAGERLSALPAAFVPNFGQWEHRTRYVARIGAMTVFLEENGWTFTLVERTGKNENAQQADGRAAREPRPEHGRGVAVRMTFAGAGTAELSAAAAPVGRAPLLPRQRSR